MLELKQITKAYTTGGQTVQALKGISLKFRSSEFVSILGQSGSGKTTLLNIIGGLDQYTTGDLLINGKSTKDYKAKDWDTYRNHSVGFIFQSYNLIPHQTVLANVELALTLSGVSKEERRKRALEVLGQVGLSDHVHKRPNQLSGGQMQRVAIARALINDPEILLADEPTGALDSETSVQVMDLLKEIATNKLVIMVTHNPELAEEYSTRIIRVKDGELLSDSNPCEVVGKRESILNKSGETFMSFFTALSLSFNNLLTKKGRTLLTAFAGSIGIIGIALILSLSNGVQQYINRIEEDTLSSYPITLEESSLDMSAMMEALIGQNQDEVTAKKGVVSSSPMMNDILNTLSSKQNSNNLAAFKEYIESGDSAINEASNAIQYGYDINIDVYNENSDDGIVQVNPSQVMNALGIGEALDARNSILGASSLTSNDVWEELLDNPELLDSQYQVLAGAWPQNYNEVILIVDEDQQVSDYLLYSIGLLSQEELAENFEAVQNNEEVETLESPDYTFGELLGMTFKLVLPTDYYQKENGMWIDQRENEDYLAEMVAGSEDIHIVGIVAPRAGTVSGSTTGSVGYTSDLTQHVVQAANEAEIVAEQQNDPDTNVFTGLPFSENEEEFSLETLTPEQQANMAALSQEELAQVVASYQENASATLETNLAALGAVDLEDPSSINIYAKDFDSKEQIAAMIDDYNAGQTAQGNEENVITYSDLVGTMMNSVTNIIDIVSYVLIAFVGVSLVVSSIMIGIITYISVLERTKEIGILRSVGASKRDISRVFNAETFIIGLLSGVIGIGLTVLANIPISAIIEDMTGIAGIASLPIAGGVGLILISMVLTVIAGLIPSRIASRKDPVEALRTE